MNNPNWAPSLKLGHKSSQSTSGDSTRRYNRIVQRNSRKRVREAEGNKRDDAEERDHIEQREDLEQDVENGKAEQTDMTSQDLMKLKDESQYTEQVHKEIENQIVKLKKEVDELVFQEEAFKNNNEKVLFYTGLSSWEVFDVLFKYIKPQIKEIFSFISFSAVD